MQEMVSPDDHAESLTHLTFSSCPLSDVYEPWLSSRLFFPRVMLLDLYELRFTFAQILTRRHLSCVSLSE